MLAALADPILPVFALMALGYVAGRTGRISGEDARVLNRFAMTVLLPIFLFRAMALAPITDFNLPALVIYLAVEAVFYATGYGLARRLFGCGTSEALLLGFCAVFANNAYYVLPIAKFLYGESQTLPIASVVTLDAVFAFGITMILLEARRGGEAAAPIGVVIGRILRLPLIWALAAGLAASALSLSLPAPVDTFTAFSGSAASPIALFAMGVILAGTPLRPEPVVYVIAAIKVVVFPLAVAGALIALLPASGTVSLFILASAGPSGVMAFSLALLYSVRTDAVMQVTVVTSVLTLLTLAYLA